MDCKEFRERLDPYVDGELAPESAGEMRGHLKGCASCAKVEAGLLSLRSSLKRVVNRHRPPHELERKVLCSLHSPPSPRSAFDESDRVGTPVWRARVAVPVPVFALLVLSVVVLAGWLVYARGPGRVEVSTRRPVPSTSNAPPGEASGGFDFSRYYRGERASLRVVPRAVPEGSGQQSRKGLGR